MIPVMPGLLLGIDTIHARTRCAGDGALDSGKGRIDGGRWGCMMLTTVLTYLRSILMTDLVFRTDGRFGDPIGKTRGCNGLYPMAESAKEISKLQPFY
jgi:hypothetical protein